MSTATTTSHNIGQRTTSRTTTQPTNNPTTQLERSDANRLRTTMATVRLAFAWLGVRKTLDGWWRPARQSPPQEHSQARADGSGSMTNEMELAVGVDGMARCIYYEALDLREIGKLQITRTSHVEPDAEGCWWADMGPSDGAVLGPYGRRSEALAA